MAPGIRPPSAVLLRRTGWAALLPVLVLAGCGFGLPLCAQVNSWTNPASGNWQNLDWSLGVLPGTNQSVLLTNAGWKALAIGAATAQDYAQTLTVTSLTVASPTNSFNTLLLNYAGLQTPLVVGEPPLTYPGSLTVASNSAFVMLASALRVNDLRGGQGGGFSVGGTFNQGDFSAVQADYLNVGDIGGGVYNLTNGMVLAGTESIGGNYPSVFNQFGGTNTTSLQLQSGGEYDLYEGSFGTNILLQDACAFKQFGGVVTGSLDFVFGNYLLAGGRLYCPALNVPQWPDCSPYCEAFAGFAQTGGTNICGSLTLNGIDADPLAAGGSYSMSNGVLLVSGPVSVGPRCGFSQQGGVQTNTSISLTGDYALHGALPAFFTLAGGVVSTHGVSINFGQFLQTSGTNQVAGDVVLSGTGFGAGQLYDLEGGQLTDNSVTVENGMAGGEFYQGGGIHVISNLLTVMWVPDGVAFTCDYTLAGGVLVVPDIELDDNAVFHHTGGALTNSGTLTLAPGVWDEQTSGGRLGQLQLGVHYEYGYNLSSNSTICLPKGSCTLQFVNSSALSWPNGISLIITGWNGSAGGGGLHQLIFGSDNTGLSTQQLAHVWFQDPAGVQGLFPAAILKSGEVVPGGLLSRQTTAAGLLLSWAGAMTLQSATNVAGPYSDVTAAQSPYVAPLTAGSAFFRLRPPGAPP
jgi:hypothetical protein